MRTQTTLSTQFVQRRSNISNTANHGPQRTSYLQSYHVEIEDDDEDDDDCDVIMQDDIEITRVQQLTRVANARSNRLTIPNGQTTPRRLDLSPGCDVELEDGSFLRIESTGIDFFNEPFIQGKRLLPHTAEELLMPEMDRELTWIMRFNENTEGYEKKVGFNPSHVVRICKILFTNQLYGDLNINHGIEPFNGGPVYFCRWKCSLPPMDLKRKPEDGYRHKIGKIEHLREHEADSLTIISRTMMKQMQLRIPDSEVRQRWRGSAFAQDWLGSHKTHTINDDGGFDVYRRYTFGDSFCGAGGTTCGAVKAGLAPKWAFDLDEVAMRTYQFNFGETGVQARCEHVSDFLAAAKRWRRRFMIDIAHLSPPCQPFSPANTTPNEELNEKNRAALTSVDDILKLCKPRLATLEEAAGMEHPRHQGWLRKLVTMFVDNGYSVRWEIVSLRRFGVPQTRDRLIVIASGPGEKLPPFILPTHGPEPGLKPFPSIASAIDNIHPLAVDHDLPRPYDTPKRAIDAAGLAGTITTGGGGDNVYHPTGLRGYTVREHACLQTFPPAFLFAGTPTQQRRQIGNAVPPVFAAALFGQLKACLEKADLEELRMRQVLR